MALNNREYSQEYYAKLKEIDGFARVAQRLKNTPTMTTVRNKEALCKLLDQPLQNKDKLIDLSVMFENKNGYYKRFLLYLANLPLYNTMIIPSSLENPHTIRDGYTKVNNLVEKLNLKANLPMFTYSVLKNGVGYFYEIEDKFGITYKEIPAQLCRVSYLDNGVYRVEVNVRRIQQQDLEFLPREFTLRQEEADNEGWLLLGNKAFALPFNSNPYSIPVFASLFPILFDIETNKLTNYEDMKEDKTKLIHCKLDTDEDGDIKTDLDTVKIFLSMLKENLPRNIKATATPFNVEALKVQDNNTSTEKNVMDIMSSLAFNEAGISELLFNNSANAEGLKLSVRKDEMVIYNSILPLLDNYVNYKIAKVDTRFKVKVLRSSYYSQSEDIKNALNVMNLGGSRTYTMALLGFNPLETENLLAFEQNILNVNTLFTPPLSAWNSSQSERDAADKSESETKDETTDIRPTDEEKKLDVNNEPVKKKSTGRKHKGNGSKPVKSNNTGRPTKEDEDINI